MQHEGHPLLKCQISRFTIPSEKIYLKFENKYRDFSKKLQF